MARSSHGDNNPSGPLFPYHHPTPPAGMPQPPAGPYGPPVPTPAAPSGTKAQPTPAALFSALRRRWGSQQIGLHPSQRQHQANAQQQP